VAACAVKAAVRVVGSSVRVKSSLQTCNHPTASERQVLASGVEALPPAVICKLPSCGREGGNAFFCSISKVTLAYQCCVVDHACTARHPGSIQSVTGAPGRAGRVLNIAKAKAPGIDFAVDARRASADDASVEPARFPRLRQLRHLRIEDSLFFNVGYLVRLAASGARNNTRRWAAADAAGLKARRLRTDCRTTQLWH